MGFLYVNENGATIGVEANQCTVNYKDGMKRLIPIESLDGMLYICIYPKKWQRTIKKIIDM